MKNKIKTLYDIMLEENLSELEISSKEYSVSIKRKKDSEQDSADIETSSLQKQAAQAKPQKNIPPQEHTAVSSSSAESIKSPISGIFYRAPSPASPPFVNEGDIIEAGKVICIIEAMKVMNEIKAPSKVKILKICIENAKSVTSGQNIFEIEKA